MNYYNEFDPFAVAWLRELIKEGHLPKGDVDARSLLEVTAADLKGYTQCHFFAGIGGWSLALKLANWSPKKPVWTGSCPCQPFSVAGRQKGNEDERHLWPIWYRLIAKCKPSKVFGEQVASAISQHWLDLVSTDLENSGYAVGAAVFTAACAGAPHIRDRLYWVGNAEYGRSVSLKKAKRSFARDANSASNTRSMADAAGKGLEGSARKSLLRESSGFGVDGDVANSRLGQWDHSHWAACTDGACRPFERGSFPFSYGVSDGMGRRGRDSNARRIHGYGNAIVPQQAALFIRASK